MDADEGETLLAALELAGWTWREGCLQAPNRSMWLDRDLTSWGDRESFRDRMIGRRDRIRANLEPPSEYAAELAEALADVDSLIEVLTRGS